jgi:mono/diheme cytochrome c family protein
MTKRKLKLWSLSTLAVLSVILTAPARAQFTQNREKLKIDISGYPAETQKGYRVFSDKCGECHTLDTSLKPTLAPSQMQAKAWKAIIKKMQDKASSHISDKDVETILAFLDYDQAHRKPQAQPGMAEMPMMNEMMMGRQLYAAQNCNNCHTIAGKGADVGPDLTDVGTRLSRDQMMKVLQGANPGASGVMPPLPPDTSEQQINALVDYLATLKK